MTVDMVGVVEELGAVVDRLGLEATSCVDSGGMGRFDGRFIARFVCRPEGV